MKSFFERKRVVRKVMRAYPKFSHIASPIDLESSETIIRRQNWPNPAGYQAATRAHGILGF